MKKAEAISILATSVRPREPKDRARYDEAVKMAIEALKCSETPKSSERTAETAQADHIAESGRMVERTAETAQNVQDEDLISRKAAIDAAIEAADDWDGGCSKVRERFIRDALEELPSAQPEIIRCRNCKFASGDSRICMKFGHSPIGELDFCAWAERRTDEA